MVDDTVVRALLLSRWRLTSREADDERAGASWVTWLLVRRGRAIADLPPDGVAGIPGRLGLGERAGLVDLFRCVRHHLRGGHHFALMCQRFISLVTECRSGGRSCDRTRGRPPRSVDPPRSRRWSPLIRSVRSQVRQGRGNGQGDAHPGGASRVVVAANSCRGVVERGRGFTVIGLEAGHSIASRFNSL